MLTYLKEAIAEDMFFGNTAIDAIEEALLDDDDIKSAFLDDIELQLIGAEDDPAIARLIDNLPEELDDEKELTDELKSDLDNLIEGFIKKHNWLSLTESDFNFMDIDNVYKDISFVEI